jgi:D-alanyl-D-alanine carboxypeptidase
MYKQLHHLFSTLIAILVLFSCQKVDKKIELTNNLQVELDSLISNIKVPGANLSIILPDGNSISISSGLADIETKTIMHPMLKMPSGSIGKTYVAAIAFQLIEQGKINLSDKVLDLIKDEKWIMQIPNINELTIAMLMSHTSGLPRYEYFDGVWEEIRMNPEKVWSVHDRLSYIHNEKPLHQAGQGWGYSDSNYILLGLIIEKITGEKYETLFKSITYGLQNTFTNDSLNLKGLASGYSGFLPNYGLPEKVYSNGKFVFNPQMEWCGGGVSSTATDLARWAKMLYEGSKVSKESIYNMTTPVNFETDLSDKARYGYGCIITISDSLLYYGHQGFFPGYRSIVQYNPKYKFSIALQFNRDNPKTKQSLNVLLHPFKELVILHLQNQITQL